MKTIELLAPAKDAAIARQALLHGADAVYMGASHHGARAAAGNSIDDIASTVNLAHSFGARVYVTVNTLVYDNELRDVERLVRELYRIGVDALIVQDLGLLRLDLPPIALHASTQCDIRTPDKARFLASVGFSQIVIARECTLRETSEIAEALPPDVVVEAFCHGALCVSFSGDCQASFITTGRSANRGECAQICRLPYDLTDVDGNILIKNRHLLSLRDLNRSAYISDMLDAGVTSFKIEGRLKNEAYVKNTVSAYRAVIDGIIANAPERWRRASAGSSVLSFVPDLNRSFNRGYTPYFIAPRPSEPMGAHLSPKSIGTPVGTVVRAEGNVITARLDTPLANGDGLGYFDPQGRFTGFRLNRVEGNRLTAATCVGSLAGGTTLWRNRDKVWDDMLAGDTARRTIAVEMTLRPAGPGRIALDVVDETGLTVTLTAEAPGQTAQTPQLVHRRRALEKTGATVYRVAEVTDTLGDRFVPAAVVSDLRRRALERLASLRLSTHRRPLRRAELPGAEAPDELTYHDNVANSCARHFYTDHGAAAIDPALEVAKSVPRLPLTVMTTRYCLRRELGACLRTSGASKLPGRLRLKAPGIDFRLDFECRNCRMKVIKDK